MSSVVIVDSGFVGWLSEVETMAAFGDPPDGATRRFENWLWKEDEEVCMKISVLVRVLMTFDGV